MPPEPHAPLPLAKTVGTGGGATYELLGRLALGGMAELYLARSRAADGRDQVVVLKRILPHLAEDPEFVRMFRDEAYLAATLSHPNIVKVFDIGKHGEDYFFTMQYVHGENLRAILRKAQKSGTAIPLPHVLTIALGITAGLHYAHEQVDHDGKPLKIVHRDVSPTNVLVAYDGAIKIVDFGIAKAAAGTHITQAGMLKGKASYMAPEQCRAESVDRRSDVFAIGILLFEMTTLTRLFRGENELAILHQVLTGAVPPPSTRRQGYPPALERIVLKALQTDPQRRYQTAAELQADLTEFARSHGLTPSNASLGQYLRSLFGDKPLPWKTEETAPPPAESSSALQTSAERRSVDETDLTQHRDSKTPPPGANAAPARAGRPGPPPARDASPRSPSTPGRRGAGRRPAAKPNQAPPPGTPRRAKGGSATQAVQPSPRPPAPPNRPSAVATPRRGSPIVGARPSGPSGVTAPARPRGAAPPAKPNAGGSAGRGPRRPTKSAGGARWRPAGNPAIVRAPPPQPPAKKPPPGPSSRKPTMLPGGGPPAPPLRPPPGVAAAAVTGRTVAPGGPHRAAAPGPTPTPVMTPGQTVAAPSAAPSSATRPIQRPPMGGRVPAQPIRTSPITGAGAAPVPQYAPPVPELDATTDIKTQIASSPARTVVSERPHNPVQPAAAPPAAAPASSGPATLRSGSRHPAYAPPAPDYDMDGALDNKTQIAPGNDAPDLDDDEFGKAEKTQVAQTTAADVAAFLAAAPPQAPAKAPRSSSTSAPTAPRTKSIDVGETSSTQPTGLEAVPRPASGPLAAPAPASAGPSSRQETLGPAGLPIPAPPSPPPLRPPGAPPPRSDPKQRAVKDTLFEMPARPAALGGKPAPPPPAAAPRRGDQTAPPPRAPAAGLDDEETIRMERMSPEEVLAAAPPPATSTVPNPVMQVQPGGSVAAAGAPVQGHWADDHAGPAPSALHHASYDFTPPKKGAGGKIAIILLSVVLIGLVAAGGWYFFLGPGATANANAGTEPGDAEDKPDAPKSNAAADEGPAGDAAAEGDAGGEDGDAEGEDGDEGAPAVIDEAAADLGSQPAAQTGGQPDEPTEPQDTAPPIDEPDEPGEPIPERDPPPQSVEPDDPPAPAKGKSKVGSSRPSSKGTSKTKGTSKAKGTSSSKSGKGKSGKSDPPSEKKKKKKGSASPFSGFGPGSNVPP